MIGRFENLSQWMTLWKESKSFKEPSCLPPFQTGAANLANPTPLRQKAEVLWKNTENLHLTTFILCYKVKPLAFK